MNFADLKRASQQGGNLSDFAKAAAEQSQGSSYEDDRMWKLTVNKENIGHATIRFLPLVSGDQYPWVLLYSHGFQGPNGKWYIENCPTTLGKEHPCPVCQANNAIWDENTQDVARKLTQGKTRRKQYYSNVYIIDDPLKPENNGKVKLFAYGQKIFDMVMLAMNPKFGEAPINVFDFWRGANFNLRAFNNSDDQRTYEKSAFGEVGPLFDDDSKLEEIYNQQYLLKDLIAPTQFKTYDQLKSRYNRAMGISDKATEEKAQQEIDAAFEDNTFDTPSFTSTPSFGKKEEEKVEDVASASTSGEEDSSATDSSAEDRIAAYNSILNS